MKYYQPVFHFIGRPFKKLKLFLKQKAGWLGIPKIIMYRGFGNENQLFVTGRVLEDSGLAKPKDKQKIWINILATIKRFSSDEIPGVKVKATWKGEIKTTITDEYGFFTFNFKLKEEEKSNPHKYWYKINVELLDKIVENQHKTMESGSFRLIPSSQKRIIISDIDDTVLVSHATQILKKLRLMLLKNAHTRLPFEGVAEFYRALEKGKSGEENYPFFFVSRSEWNLYDLLDDFFYYHNIPKGVFILRKLNHSIYKFWKRRDRNHEHKYEEIKSLFAFYNTQKFILIGDSGQRDPEIYMRLALDFPGRVEAIYIRKVKSKKAANFSVFHNKLLDVNTRFIEVHSSHDAMKHAQKEGYIA